LRVAITGSSGFIGSHLRLRLQESRQTEVITVPRDVAEPDLRRSLEGVDWVFHVAGVNRPENPQEFYAGNSDFTDALCAVLDDSARPPSIVFASSVQSDLDNDYGKSKRSAETRLRAYGRRHGVAVRVYRLPNVFGKWARPFYNSVVATFCHQLARGIPIVVRDPDAALQLLYIDDLMSCWQAQLQGSTADEPDVRAGPVWDTTVGELARILVAIRDSRAELIAPPAGTGLVRALYATYLSHLPPEAFNYALARHEDSRGRFVEFLKTSDCGQFSYFTAHPGVTRGEHYHHTKTEKFLVVQGTAHFRFRHILSGEAHECTVHGANSEVVQTVPGWAHSITNTGDDELIVLLWANEIFDRAQPDTYALRVAP
jgi:UDP-2-acetamido-2,6-beta-L-arabino-hexul-4-ose reductase